MSDLVGQQLGNYRLLRLLGVGGFGDVYLGEHIHLGTQAAIKVLQARLAHNDMQSFLQEGRTVARLEHPNIVRILEFGVEQPANIPFLVMTYAPNGTIRQRYPRGSRVPLDQVVTYVRQVAGALQYAHGQNFIHRDIKPENFLLGRNNEVLLSDFGTALLSQSSRSQSTKDIIGTAAYMSPEQLQGKPVPASDQYSLGVVVYEWLSGECPFQGSFMELYSQHLNVAAVPLHEKVPGLSQDIAQVIQRSLAKEARFRFPDMQSFADALARACEPTVRVSSLPANMQPTPPVASANPSQPPISSPALPVTPPATFSSAPTFVSPLSSTLPSPMPGQEGNYGPVSGGPMSSGPIPPGFQTPGTPSGHRSPTFAGATTSGPYTNPGIQASPARRSSSRKKTIGILSAVVVALLIIAVVGATVVPRILSGTTGQIGNTPSNQSGGNTGGSSSGNSGASGGVTPTPAPSPTPLAPGSVIYQATFDSTDFGNWTGDNSHQWKLIGNGEIGSDGSGDGSSNGGFIIWYQHEMPVQNYAVEAKIQYVRSTSSDSYEDYREFGIMVRGDGDKNGYEGGMEAGSSSGYGCSQDAIISYVQQDNSSTNCDENTYLNQVAYTLDSNVHVYRLEVRGNSLQLFLDNQDQPLLSTTDNTLVDPGRVGLRSVYADINVLSFKVTAL